MAGVMPFGSKERDAAGLLLVEIVGSVLEELVSTNASGDTGGSATGEVTKFHGLRAPQISVAEYLSRISRFSGCSNPCFILSLIYIDRLITRKRVVLDPLNVHRLVITSVLLAAKFFDDHYLDNAHYAAVGGIPARELNALEVEFAFLAEFHFHVTANDYDMYHTALANKAQSQRVARGVVLPVPQLPYQQPQTQGGAPGQQLSQQTTTSSNPDTHSIATNGVSFAGHNPPTTFHPKPQTMTVPGGSSNGGANWGSAARQ